MKFNDSKAKAAVLKKATALKAKGRTNAQIMEELGLSHSQLEIHLLDARVAEGEFGGYLTIPEAESTWATQIAKLRAGDQSWGLIAIRYQVSESRVRRVFRTSGLDSRGMRIGKGGRWLANDPRFYTGADRPKLGTEIMAGTPIGAQVPADPQAEPKRKLTAVAKGKAAPRKRAPRKPKAEAPKAEATEATPEAPAEG